jgi:hypothetical protein
MSPDAPAPRRIDPGPVSFAVPEGYEDLTDYTFTSPDGKRVLHVQPSKVSGVPFDPEAAAALAEQQLADLFPGGQATVVEKRPVPATDGIAAGTVLVVTFPEGRGRVRQQDAYLRLTDDSGLRLALTTRPSDRAAAWFDKILATIRPAGRALPPLPRGLRPFQGAGFVLGAPAALQFPQHYQFATPDADARLRLRLREEGPPVVEPFVSPDALAREAEAAGGTGRRPGGGLEAAVTEAAGPGEESAPSEARSKLERGLEDLTRSIHLKS